MNKLLNKHIIKFLAALCFACYFTATVATNCENKEYITITILAKDKAHTLPFYLSCLEKQTWPKDQTYLYIRTNNNNDGTATILREWIARIGNEYAKIYFDDTNVAEPVQQFGQHEWNHMRLKVLCTIRQKSLNWAQENNSHYFIADCDNFIFPETIETMLNTHQPIVAPLLRCSGQNSNFYYSNYHYAIDDNGYYASSPFYYNVLNQEVKGLIEVPVIHCTYLVRSEVLNKLTYDDKSARYDYVIFSHSARKNAIPQYIDNRKIYGYLTFAETTEDFNKEPFLTEFSMIDQIAQ